ncbi:DUF1553 domain-containing protein [Calycomorphotria hydatis]|uniref:DUF1549 domain-containing protein n=1 Tax=Calycomorphotria hydatis TaxID=2528027 RepID=A0A517T6M2_9PLAN|nr:DUF1553 domain-containing protein [Calycomorphotria hydatis]QDT64019.1 hypothetical protein V22_12490 [Calycomorphotria hydatis]
MTRTPLNQHSSRFQGILRLGFLCLLLVASATFTQGGVAVGQVIRGSDEEIVAEINRLIAQSWTDNEVQPSRKADDGEWLRRVCLDIVGHIPPADVVNAFLSDRDPSKRVTMVNYLVEDPAYVRNWTTIWTNLCIGQSTPRRTSRLGMKRFFEDAFSNNRPWDEVVYDLINAKGHFETNGEVNFLLAQMTMRDDEVQATAKTAKLFLGMQLQCTQCHNHPFNDWKQDQFWQFNSFFKQARRRDVRKEDPETGRMVDDYSELIARDFSGPVYFEERSGLMQVAFPTYFGKEVDPGEETDRRQLLAGLMIADDSEPYVARAFVNRMWSHFFGYGFTRPVDDMGPHNPPSHPLLLDMLTEQFVNSGYDVKRLIRWIASSEPYQLSSQINTNNEYDNPAAGETPLFSHMYVKRMTAEQLYDSLIVATNAHMAGKKVEWGQAGSANRNSLAGSTNKNGSANKNASMADKDKMMMEKEMMEDPEEAERLRQRWLQQFVVAFGTDENDESTTFNGTIPQALMMMNGELIRNAVSAKEGSFLHRVLTEERSDTAAIKRIYLAALARPANAAEQRTARRLFAASATPLEGYQDLFWALLNSNEFIFIK